MSIEPKQALVFACLILHSDKAEAHVGRSFPLYISLLSTMGNFVTLFEYTLELSINIMFESKFSQFAQFLSNCIQSIGFMS